MTQGYKQKKGFIIAENPMESTVSTFVRMLHERECGVVVMLCECEEGGVEICAQYWPTYVGTATKHGEFTVSTESISEKDEITKRVITISDNKVWCMKSSHCIYSHVVMMTITIVMMICMHVQCGRVHKFTQFEIKQWTSDNLCSTPKVITDVINQMNSVQRRTGNKPIVVHGRYVT